MKTFEELLESAKEASACRETTGRLENMIWCTEYAEPGYTDPGEEKVIAFANWNYVKYKDENGEKKEDFTMESLAEALEEHGHEIEWDDEWTWCTGCNKAIRIRPNSYGWTMYGYFNEEHGETVCGECVKEDPEEYLEYLKGDYRKCNTLLDLSEHGYKQHEGGFEAGFYPGQNDKPEDAAAYLESYGVEDYIFSLDGKGQFDISWSVWLPEQTELEEEAA